MQIYFIDDLVNNKIQIHGNWFIAKPFEYGDNIFERIHHGWMVLIGKARAIRFEEDFRL